MGDLGAVDMSRKYLIIDMRWEGDDVSNRFLQVYHKEIESHVRSFFGRHNIGVVFASVPEGGISNAVRAHFVDINTFYTHTSLSPWKNFVGYANGKTRSAYINTNSALLLRDDSDSMVQYYAHVLEHEVLHLLSLKHTDEDELSDDAIMHSGHGKPDCYTTLSERLDPAEVVQLHSFLGCGKAYEAFGGEYPDFAFYTELTKEAACAKRDLEALLE